MEGVLGGDVCKLSCIGYLSRLRISDDWCWGTVAGTLFRIGRGGSAS